MRDTKVVDAFDGLTLVDEESPELQSELSQFEPLRTWLGHVVVADGEEGQIVSQHYLSHRDKLSDAAYWSQWPALWTELEVGLKEYAESWINAIRLSEL